LNAENKETNCTSINNWLCELVIVLGNAGKSKCGCLLYGGVELFQAVNQCIKSAWVNNSLGKVGWVLGDGSENVSGGFLVETLYENLN
jgi:hypothetical protein